MIALSSTSTKIKSGTTISRFQRGLPHLLALFVISPHPLGGTLARNAGGRRWSGWELPTTRPRIGTRDRHPPTPESERPLPLYLTPHLGKKPLNRLTPAQLRAFMAELKRPEVPPAAHFEVLRVLRNALSVRNY